MNPQIKQALINKLTALADDELILAHRNSEWIGHAPILEEDIALANMAQDELGHAMLYFELRKELDASDPDQLAFFRDAGEFQNVMLVEFPKGDWAFTLLRQYFFDAYESLWLYGAQQSSYTPLAEAAAKMLREERFHVQHSQAWVQRLGLGTEESNRRMQNALEEQWAYAQQLFQALPDEHLLVQENIVPDLEGVKEKWLEHTTTHLKASDLQVSETLGFIPQSRREHSEYLWSLLAEMQSTARWDAEAEVW